MTPRERKHRRPAGIGALLALMDEWPQSWAGDEDDEPIGRHLTAMMRPFMAHLHGEKLSPRTLRRHLDNLWLIGGEIVRQLNDDPPLRTKPIADLLLDAVAEKTPGHPYRPVQSAPHARQDASHRRPQGGDSNPRATPRCDVVERPPRVELAREPRGPCLERQ